jgi:hypothetical protein
MAIEDRLRDGLRRTAAQVDDQAPLSEDLWLGIGRGIHRARRRQAAIRVGTIAFSLIVFAAIMAWVAIGFTGLGRHAADRGAGLSVRNVRVFGAPDGFAKIYGTVANRGPQAVGAQVTCRVLDASGHPLGTATGSLPYVPAGASKPLGPLGGRYRGVPSSARCTVEPLPPVAPSPAEPVTPAFQPGTVAFWSEQDGILAGAYGQPSCFPRCTWFLEATHDGGQSWQKVLRTEPSVYDIAVYGSSDAWALSGPCAMGTCQIQLLFSGDGGRSWTKRSTTDLKRVSFVSASDGWGVGNVFPDESQQIESTSDGGRTWHGRPAPCPQVAPMATDVSFVSPARGWLLCTGEGSAGNENRVVLETSDGGGTWTKVAEAILGERTASGLTSSEYPTGISFVDEGHGWMWADRAVGIEATTDGGRSWRVVGTVPNGASTSIGSVEFVSDSTGFALLANGDQQATQLIQTLDGGRNWRVVSSWPYEAPTGTVIARGRNAGTSWMLAAHESKDGGISLEVDLPGQGVGGVLPGPTGEVPDLWVSSVPLGTGSDSRTLVFGFVAARVSSVHIEPTHEIGKLYRVPGQRHLMAFVVVARHSSSATIVAEDEGGMFLAQQPLAPIR